MKIVKGLAMGLGVVMILIGGLWIGQGLNIIRWPADSFMIGVPQWSWNGTGVVVVGALLLWWSRRS